MCKALNVSKIAFYGMQNYLPSKRRNENRMLLSQIRRIHQLSRASYGSPRMTDKLKALGFTVSRPRVARLMAQHNIHAVHAKKFVVTTDSKHTYPVAENILDRKFSAPVQSQAWVSDITYIKTAKGWLYLTVILDLFDRKVIGWAQSSDMGALHISLAAWKMAINDRPISNGLVFHSDKGIQYACNEFTNLIDSYQNVQRSMSRKGNCWDNAVAESFFKTLKVEHIYGQRFESKEEAALSIFERIETWYNHNRRHSALGNRTIKEFNKIAQIKNAA